MFFEKTEKNHSTGSRFFVRRARIADESRGNEATSSWNQPLNACTTTLGEALGELEYASIDFESR